MAKKGKRTVGRLYQNTDAQVRAALSQFGLEVMPGEVARAIRMARNMSLKDVADRVESGTHFTTIGKLETGKRRFTADWGHILAEALEVPSSAFFDPGGAFNTASRISIYTSLLQIRAHPFTSANTLDYFAGNRKNVYGVFISTGADIAGELNLQTILIDPNCNELVHGKVYLFARKGDEEFSVGIYRGDTSRTRFILWPTTGPFPEFLTEEHEIFGQVFEMRRHLAGPNV